MTREDVQEGLNSGFLAGLIFLILEMVLVPLFLQGSTWGPPRMIAAIIMGQNVLPPPASFNLGIVLIGLILHFALSAFYGVVLVSIVRNMSKEAATASGLVFGLVLYIINFYLFTELFFPWFAAARNWITIVAHLTFGGTAAYAIKAFQDRYYRKCVNCR